MSLSNASENSIQLIAMVHNRVRRVLKGCGVNDLCTFSPSPIK